LTSPTIQIRHLRYFLAVSDELHFGRAAVRLSMAQPPLSQAIRQLEDALGVRLLDRTSRGVRLTAAGQVFAEHARTTLANLDVAVAEARRAGGVMSVLRIGSTPHIPIERLQHLLRALRTQLPVVQPRITHLHAGEPVTRLHTGALDLAVIHDFPGGDVAGELLFPGQALRAVVPAGHAAHGREAVTPSDLDGETLVMFDRALNPPLYEWVVRQADEAGYRFAGVEERGGHDARDIALAVAEGAGVAMVPPAFAHAWEVGGTVASLALDPAVQMPGTILAWSANPPNRLRRILGPIRAAAHEVREADAGDAAPTGRALHRA
jgi:DNA-binding transcriptional LysR family regulator